VNVILTLSWQYVVGLVHREDLPMTAARLLADGYDSPCLRELAGEPRTAHPADLDELWRQSLDELRAPAPDEELAERCLLHDMAARVSHGAMTPSEAAWRIWQGIAAETECEKGFVTSVDDEWWVSVLSMERPGEFATWQASVRAAAAVLARTPFPLPGPARGRGGGTGEAGRADG
jgi:hypothetical protein